MSLFSNPFRPGAGHTPPHLAGRDSEIKEFTKLLDQDVILNNVVITGLRGVGKTVLSDQLKPIAMSNNWAWVGTDLSESASLSEERIAIRLLTDLSVFTSTLQFEAGDKPSIGFVPDSLIEYTNLSYQAMLNVFQATPGLVSDKLKRVLEVVWNVMQLPINSGISTKKIIFAYDEAQNLTDHADKNEFPTSLLLDVFQSIQKQGISFMLVLVGLPTLFPKLVESRTFAERMFRVMQLQRLNSDESREAILIPINDAQCPVTLDDPSVEKVITLSAGYPYFIQFICREVYDAFTLGIESVPVSEITHKLDCDFFAGRWAKATDRQKELLGVIASLDHAEEEFSVQDIVVMSKEKLEKSFSSSSVNQMLSSLTNSGLVYKNRHGIYSFAVPLMSRFILRQEAS